MEIKISKLDWNIHANVVGGYTFCKALLREAITTGKPVDFTCEGNVHAIYTYNPTKPFVAGITLQSADTNSSYQYLIQDPAKGYDIHKGLQELAEEGVITQDSFGNYTTRELLVRGVKNILGWNKKHG